MRHVYLSASPLLIGMFLLMLGNGLQSTALGVRGGLENFSSLTMGFVMSGYFVGFLGGAQLTPRLLRRVGHVRVFAALASMISAAMILYAAVVDPVAWIVMRILVGFCMSGVYVVAESWLNDSTDNAHRGQVLSAYLIVQMLGIVIAQAALNIADPAGYDLFIIMSVAVSVAVVPILLSATPVPVFESNRSMSLGELYTASPLGFVGCTIVGAIFACLFGMSAVYAAKIGLTNVEISIFIGMIYLGGLLCQFPIGWLSDRMDRRVLIEIITALGAVAAAAVLVVGPSLTVLLMAAFVIGGVSNPLYSLLIAHTNDNLEHDQMASASGGLIMMNGIGAAGTPILVGALMDLAGSEVFLVSIAALLFAITSYALYRSTVRPATPTDETVPYAPYSMGASPVAGAYTGEYVAEQAEAEAQAREAEEQEPRAEQAPSGAAQAAPIPAVSGSP